MITIQQQLPLILLLLCVAKPVLTQSPSPSPSPSSSASRLPRSPRPPSGPTNVVKILKKSGQYTTFIHLLKITQLDTNLNSQLGDTNNGLTILAPSDSAFSSLKKGTLKSLNRQKKMELVQFHVIPVFISPTQFDTVTNPLKTHAGSGDRLQLNVTTNGDSVNVTTGVTNTSISGTVYLDKHLAIYSVEKVLLPLDIFSPKSSPPPPPAPAPRPAKAKEKKGKSAGGDDDEDQDEEDDGSASGGVKKDASCAIKKLNIYKLYLFGVGAFGVLYMS